MPSVSTWRQCFDETFKWLAAKSVSIYQNLYSHSWSTNTPPLVTNNPEGKQLSSQLKWEQLMAKGSSITQKLRRQMVGVLTWVSANKLWPRALLGGRWVGGANQLVLGHLGVGLGELQPQGLGDLWIKPDALRSNGKMCQQKCVLASFYPCS